MRIALLLTCLAICSCGRAPEPVNDELTPFFGAFESNVGVDTSDISAELEPVDKPAIGICFRWSNGDKHISIDPTAWSKMTDIGREQLVYHELGHCAMELGHDDRRVTLPDTRIVPGSIMNMYWFGNANYYSQYRPQYWVALANRSLMNPW